MRAAVVYESMYGNTHEIAEAVAEGLREHGEVALYPVGDAGADVIGTVDLLVVGGPTHMHGMASSMSRKAALEDADKKEIEVDPDAEGPGLRSWFHDVPTVDGAKAAAFDTRGQGPAFLVGSAAKGIAKRLRRHGYELVADPEGFLVTDSEGPLVEGERDRARAWGSSLGAAVG